MPALWDQGPIAAGLRGGVLSEFAGDRWCTDAASEPTPCDRCRHFHFFPMPRRELLLESCEDRILCSAAAPVEAPQPQKDPALATATHAQEVGNKDATAMADAPAASKDAGNEQPTATADEAAAPDAARREIVFVDTSTQNYEQLVADIRGRSEPGTEMEVVLLDPGRDGVAQISETLAGR